MTDTDAADSMTTNEISLSLTLEQLQFAPEEDSGKREFAARILPWGAVTGDYRKLSFNKGSVSWDAENIQRHKVLAVHNSFELRTLIGVATAIKSDKDGLHATFRLGHTPEADLAWSLMKDGILDGVSVGLSMTNYEGVQYNEDSGTYTVLSGAVLREVSLVPIPAFADARVSAGAEVSAAFAALSNTAPAVLSLNEGVTLPNEIVAPEATPVAVAASVDTDAITAAIQAGNVELAEGIAAGIVAGLAKGAEAHAAANEGLAAAPAAQASVTERPDYGFGAAGSTYSFTRDLALSKYSDDGEAKARLTKLSGQIADSTVNLAQVRADVVALSPTKQRPDLYQAQLEYTRPLFDAVSKGPLDEITPFVLPKWVSSSGLMGDHTEGTHPTSGTISLTTQTITPKAVSGAYRASREAFESGNPALDTIALNAMFLDYEEDVEAYIAAGLAAVSLSGAHAVVVDQSNNVTAGVSDGVAIADAQSGILIDQVFSRGGRRVNRSLLAKTLFQPLVIAKDEAGRPLFPSINAVNANGTVSAGLDAINVNGQITVPAWALAASTGYVFAQQSVWHFASALRMFRFEEKNGPEDIELALFGYQGRAVLRDDDVYKITIQA